MTTMKGVWLALCVVGVASSVCVTVNPQLSDPLNSPFPCKLQYSRYGNEY